MLNSVGMLSAGAELGMSAWVPEDWLQAPTRRSPRALKGLNVHCMAVISDDTDCIVCGRGSPLASTVKVTPSIASSDGSNLHKQRGFFRWLTRPAESIGRLFAQRKTQKFERGIHNTFTSGYAAPFSHPLPDVGSDSLMISNTELNQHVEGEPTASQNEALPCDSTELAAQPADLQHQREEVAEAAAREQREAADPEQQQAAEPEQQQAAQPEQHEAAEPEQQQAAEPEQQQAAEPEQQQAAEPEQHEAADPEQQQAAEPEQREAADPEQQQAAEPEQHEAADPEQREAADPEQQQAAEPEQQQAAEPKQREAAEPEQQQAAEPEQQQAAEPEQRDGLVAVEPASQLNHLPSLCMTVPGRSNNSSIPFEHSARSGAGVVAYSPSSDSAAEARCDNKGSSAELVRLHSAGSCSIDSDASTCSNASGVPSRHSVGASGASHAEQSCLKARNVVLESPRYSFSTLIQLGTVGPVPFDSLHMGSPSYGSVTSTGLGFPHSPFSLSACARFRTAGSTTGSTGGVPTLGTPGTKTVLTPHGSPRSLFSLGTYTPSDTPSPFHLSPTTSLVQQPSCPTSPGSSNGGLMVDYDVAKNSHMGTCKYKQDREWGEQMQKVWKDNQLRKQVWVLLVKDVEQRRNALEQQYAADKKLRSTNRMAVHQARIAPARSSQQPPSAACCQDVSMPSVESIQLADFGRQFTGIRTLKLQAQQLSAEVQQLNQQIEQLAEERMQGNLWQIEAQQMWVRSQLQVQQLQLLVKALTERKEGLQQVQLRIDMGWPVTSMMVREASAVPASSSQQLLLPPTGQAVIPPSLAPIQLADVAYQFRRIRELQQQAQQLEADIQQLNQQLSKAPEQLV